MDIQAKKLEIVQLIINTEKPALLKVVEDILKRSQNVDWWDEIGEDEKRAIEQGLAEADRDELIPHENVMQEIKAKYNLDL